MILHKRKETNSIKKPILVRERNDQNRRHFAAIQPLIFNLPHFSFPCINSLWCGEVLLNWMISIPILPCRSVPPLMLSYGVELWYACPSCVPHSLPRSFPEFHRVPWWFCEYEVICHYDAMRSWWNWSILDVQQVCSFLWANCSSKLPFPSHSCGSHSLHSMNGSGISFGGYLLSSSVRGPS